MSERTLYTNYEDAQNRTDSDDLFVVRLLTAIHRSMLENANTKWQPDHPFDMRYYYDALVRSVANDYDYHLQGVNDVDSPTSAVNIPDFSESVWANMHFVQNGMAGRFAKLVQSESKSDGSPFDLSFACYIAAMALDEETLQFVHAGIGEKSAPAADDFDDWLGGFTAPDES